MIKYCWHILVLTLLVHPSTRKTIWLCGDSTMAIKETNRFPETGWGMPFAHFWTPDVRVVNLAKNGRSTKTFRNEGLWQQVVDQAKPGDYVFIQFGHNDESVEKVDRYSPPDSFVYNLKRFVQEARQLATIPVLFTPVSRRKFDSTGQALPTHVMYSSLVKQVATDLSVTCIDLDGKSQALYQHFGPERSKLLFLHLEPNTHPNYPDGKSDNTHFSELGARLIAQLVLQEIRIKIPELVAFIYTPVEH